MAKIHRIRTIAAAPHDIWEVLADFGSISSWADNVDHSCILEHGPDGQPHNPPHAPAYDIEGLPKRLLRMQLEQARADAVPERNIPWPYVSRRPPPPSSPRFVRRALERLRHWADG